MTSLQKQHPSLALMKRGFFVKLDISSFIDAKGYFDLKDVDLGVTAEEKQAISAQAEKFLMPKSDLYKLMNLHIKANSNLHKFSFVTKWGNFIPITAFKQWKTVNDEIRDNFFNKIKDICINYDHLVSGIKDSCAETASKLWQRLFPNSGEPTESFITSISDKIVGALPSKISLMGNVHFDSIISFLNLDHLLTNNTNLPLEEQKTNEVLKMYLLDGSHALDQFYSDTVLSNKESISTTCKWLLNDLNDWFLEKATIKKRTHIKLESLIDSFNVFNFYGDNETLEQMKSLKEEIYKPIEIMNKNKVQSLLIKIIELQR